MFPGLLLIVLTTGLSFGYKALQQETGLLTVCEIGIHELKFIVWWFYA